MEATGGYVPKKMGQKECSETSAYKVEQFY